MLKAPLIDADATMMVSALLEFGRHVDTVLRKLEVWLAEHASESIEQLGGSPSHRKSLDPAFERTP